MTETGIKTVSIIGLGAMGILYGSHLSAGMPGENLRFIADRKRIERYKKEGVYCNNQPCNFHYLAPDEKTSPTDLLLFSVKNKDLGDAIKAAKNQVGANTTILSVLNGITSESEIGRIYGDDKVLYCVAQGMDAVKAGNRMTYDNVGILCFGDSKEGTVSGKTEKVAEFFRKVNLPFEIDTNMKKRLWGKFMLNVGVNQTLAVYGDGYGDIQVSGEARVIMISAMREVIALSEKEGLELTEDDLNYWLSVVDSLGSAGKPSMRQDIDSGRPSEVELFSGTVIRLGKKYNIPTPTNEMLYNKIKTIEKSYHI